VDSEQYSKVFPNVNLRHDSKAAGRWSTNHNGEYFAIGVGGTVTGKGADLLIIDDPHSEQEAKLAATDSSVFDSVYEWYTSGPRQRLQPGGSIVIVMTRWAKRDLTGRIVKSWIDKDGEEWEIIDFPAILPSGKPLWPEFWSLAELEALRLELPLSKWQAQYQQQPTSEEGAIVKREWWKIWEKDNPPQCEFVIQSWDTAFTKNERSDYSACTTWGVWYLNENPDDPQIILLDAFKRRMEFPELKETALNHYKEWEPDAFVVEAKAAGSPLIYELRAMGIPVSEFTPSRGNDKIARINSVSDLFASGKVWAPGTRWAEEVIEEMAAFPNSDHDDLVDSSTQALIRFRKGGFIRLQSDEKEEPVTFRRKSSYY
jgi:predicted phage terminase large subunit-like protein